MEKKILFVSNRNIITTCGELRLIKNRAEALSAIYGIKTDFLAISSLKRINSDKKEKINAGGNLDVIVRNIMNPFSVLKANISLRNEIKKRIKSDNYCAVVFSGSGLQVYAKYIKSLNNNIKIIADIHGSSEDIIELVKESSVIKRVINTIIYRLDIYGLKHSVKYLDGYFVVTEALKEYIIKRYKVSQNSHFFIVPCSTTQIGDFNYDKIEEYRKFYRKKYNLNDSTKVFVYSGGVSVWQCINETIDLYCMIKDKLPNTKFLIFSHKKEEIKRILKNTEDIIIDSYPQDELLKALCVGDFSFMLRSNCITNNVAFPNKYLEYVQSGMKIITTPYIFEIANQVGKYDLGFLYKKNENEKDLFEYINLKERNNRSVVEKILWENSFKKTLKKFNDYMIGKD